MEQEKKDLKKRICYPVHSVQMQNFMEDCTHLKLDIKFVRDMLPENTEEADNVDTALENLNIIEWTANSHEFFQKPGRPDTVKSMPDYFVTLKPKKMKKLINKIASCKGSVLSSDVMLSQLCFNFPINITDIIYDCAYKLLNILLKSVDETKYPTFYDEYMHMEKYDKIKEFWKKLNIRILFNINDISNSKTFITLNSWHTVCNGIYPMKIYDYMTDGPIAISGYEWNMTSKISNNTVLKFPSLCFIYKNV